MSFGLVLILTLIFFLIFGTPIAVAVGLATILSMLTAGDINALPAITQKMFTSLDSFPLLALPLFTLSGELMEVSGISERLVRFMRMCFRKLPGGLGVHNHDILGVLRSYLRFRARNGSGDRRHHDRADEGLRL